MEPTAVALIVNPAAGGGRALRRLPAVEAALRARGLQVASERTRSLDHAGELARAAAERGGVVAAMGGEGLVGRVAGGVAGAGGVLAIVPAGRGNDFARVVGAPADPARLAELIAAGRMRSVDVGTAGGAPFVTIASAGL